MHSHWLQWYTLIFTLPTGLAILLLLLVGVGSLEGDGDGPGDADGDMDADGGDAGDGDADADAGDADAGDAGHVSHGHHIHADDGLHGDHSLGFGLRNLLGIAGVPLTIGGSGLLLGWGIGGLCALEILRPPGLPPMAFTPVAALVALGSALLFARLISRLYRLIIPRSESAAVSRHNLIGFNGTAIFPITANSGHIHLRDQHGTLHQVPARVRPERPAIPRGAPVMVLDFDADSGLLIVEPAPTTDGSVGLGAP